MPESGVRRLPIALLIGFALCCLIQGGITYWRLTHSDPLAQMAADLGMTDHPFRESVKEAALRGLPILLGLILAQQLRARGWIGALLSGLLTAALQWLLTGLIWGQWSFHHLLVPASVVASLPAVDFLVGGGNRRVRTIACLLGSAAVFVVATSVDWLLVTGLSSGSMSKLDPLALLLAGFKSIPKGYLPWLPMILAWSWGTAPPSRDAAPAPAAGEA